MSHSSSRTTRSTRRWSAAAVAAVAGLVLSAVVAVGSATGASADSRSAAAERAGDLGTTSALAPVTLPGQKKARTYSPAELERNKRIGGDPAVLAYAGELAAALAAEGVEVLLDDRKASPGVKFADAELLGMPTIVVVGRRLADGFVEVRDRASGERADVAVADAVVHLLGVVRPEA